MKNKLLALLIFTTGLTCQTLLAAEMDAELLSQSTVKVLVKDKGRIITAATGFVWLNNQSIVTSLHVLPNSKEARIIIEFNKRKRLATVKAVHKESDLVLLEVKKPVDGWIPLKLFKEEKPRHKTEVTALGFNQGALGLSTRELIKGYLAPPETLRRLLPADTLHRLEISKVLDLNLPIYYLDGSLLPGYSGSPIVDPEGVLIGVGNGGLENGASGVSWAIPAHNLVNLKNASAQLPSNLNEINQVFSADQIRYTDDSAATLDDATNPMIGWLTDFPDKHDFAHTIPMNYLSIAKSILAATNSPADDFGTMDNWPQNHLEIHYQNFTFIRTKTRGYPNLLATSSGSQDLEEVFTIYKHFFSQFKVDYNQFLFDIYEDPQLGLNIAIPAETTLTVDKHGYLVTEGEDFCQTCPYEIQFHIRQVKGLRHQNPADFLNDIANQHLDELNEEGEYKEYDAFRNTTDYGNDRYILRAAFSDFDVMRQDDYEFNYFVAAKNQDNWFQAQAILNRFDPQFFEDLDDFPATDCTAPKLQPDQQDMCFDVKTMLKILMAVHLTSFSNQILR